MSLDKIYSTRRFMAACNVRLTKRSLGRLDRRAETNQSETPFSTGAPDKTRKPQKALFPRLFEICMYVFNTRPPPLLYFHI